MADPAAALRDARQRIEVDLAALRHSLAIEGPGTTLPPYDAEGQHPSDMASDVLEREIDRSIELDLVDQLGTIDAAVVRLADGTYGRCTVCAANIDADRLEALPWTPWCHAHAAAAERADRRVLDPAVPRTLFDDTTESDDEDDHVEPAAEERALHIEHEPPSATGAS
jgi:RNA polymerase-binding transcription factor DksA